MVGVHFGFEFFLPKLQKRVGIFEREQSRQVRSCNIKCHTLLLSQRSKVLLFFRRWVPWSRRQKFSPGSLQCSRPRCVHGWVRRGRRLRTCHMPKHDLESERKRERERESVHKNETSQETEYALQPKSLRIQFSFEPLIGNHQTTKPSSSYCTESSSPRVPECRRDHGGNGRIFFCTTHQGGLGRTSGNS